METPPSRILSIYRTISIYLHTAVQGRVPYGIPKYDVPCAAKDPQCQMSARTSPQLEDFMLVQESSALL